MFVNKVFVNINMKGPYPITHSKCKELPKNHDNGMVRKLYKVYYQVFPVVCDADTDG
jgi:hypothetical protein